MTIGKAGLLASAAAAAMFAASGAQAADAKDSKKPVQAPAQAQSPARAQTPQKAAEIPVQLAQNFPGATAGVAPSNAELAARLQLVEDELAARDEKTAADHVRLSTLEQNFNYATWTYDNGRPVLSSGDGRFTMGFRLRFQSDFAGFSQDDHPPGYGDLASGAVIRRAYFGVEGKVYSDFSYELRLNAGGTNGGSAQGSGVPNAGEGDPLVNKAVVTYTGIQDWHFSVGVLEPALMMEGTTSSASLMFLERPEFENVAADVFGAGDSRRGVEIGWARTDALWAGDNLVADVTFSGAKTGTTAGHGNGGDEQSQLLGRFSERLWTNGLSNIQIGASLGHVFNSGTAAGGGSQTINLQDRPEIRVDGTRLISTGGIAAQTADMMAFDFQGNLDNLFLGAEWAHFSVDRLTPVVDHPTFQGWTIEGSWIITGETKAYSPTALNNEMGGFNMLVPSKPFSLQGGSWGAWELVARYTDTDLNWHTGTGFTNGIFGGDERVFAIGINWYLNRNVRLMIDDNIETVHRGTSLAAPDALDQDFNVVGVRLQFAN